MDTEGVCGTVEASIDAVDTVELLANEGSNNLSDYKNTHSENSADTQTQPVDKEIIATRSDPVDNENISGSDSRTEDESRVTDDGDVVMEVDQQNEVNSQVVAVNGDDTPVDSVDDMATEVDADAAGAEEGIENEGEDSVISGDGSEDEEEEEQYDGSCVYPIGRVKSIIKIDRDINLASQEAVFLIAKATELFTEYLSTQAYRYTEKGKRKTISKRDLDNALETYDDFAFLEGIIQ